MKQPFKYSRGKPLKLRLELLHCGETEKMLTGLENILKTEAMAYLGKVNLKKSWLISERGYPRQRVGLV